MSDSFLAQALPKLTDPHSGNPLFRAPFTYKQGGVAWSCACTTAYLFAVRGTSSFEKRDPPQKLKAMLAAKPPENALRVKLERLKEWAALPVTADDSPGIILGNAFSRRHLATLLAPLVFPEILIWDMTEEMKVKAIGLEVRGKWRGVLAGLDGEPEAGTPTFELHEKMGIDLMLELE